MQDFALACLYQIGLLFLIVVVSSALVAEHTEAHIPKALLYGNTVRRAGRRSLIITLPWIGAILGGGQLVVVLMLVHPASTIAVRLVSAIELVAVVAWLAFLWRLITRARKGAAGNQP